MKDLKKVNKGKKEKKIKARKRFVEQCAMLEMKIALIKQF